MKNRTSYSGPQNRHIGPVQQAAMQMLMFPLQLFPVTPNTLRNMWYFQQRCMAERRNSRSLPPCLLYGNEYQ